MNKSSVLALTIIFLISVSLSFPLCNLWRKYSFAAPAFLYPKAFLKTTHQVSKQGKIPENVFFSVPYAQAQIGTSPPLESLNRPLEPWEKDFLKCLCGGYRLNWVCCHVYNQFAPE